MKQALRNVLSFAGVLLMIASLVWISFHQEKQQAIRTQSTANRPVASGVETYYAPHQIASASALASWLPFLARPPSDSPKPESQSLADFIQEALVARTRSVDRGTQTKQFFVIANVTSPAVLIEGGFLTNKEDVSKLASEDYRDQLAAAVADGILRYRDAVSQRKSALTATGLETAE